MNASPAATRPETPRSAAFEFVRSLAQELSSGQVEIPSFPEVAARVQRVLADENVAPDRIVRVLGSEPALAARILGMANSAALNPGGEPVTDLRTAVVRMGFDMIRGTALTYAMAQVRKAPQLRGLEKPMNQLWNRSVLLASLAQVVARRYSSLKPDSAMLAGLLHGIGKLYILTRSTRHPALFGDAAAFDAIVTDWHANIARAVLENWGMTEELVEAVHQFDDPDREPRGLVCLTDVLAVAHVFALHFDQPASVAAALHDNRYALRLQMGAGPFEVVFDEARAEMQALRRALGD
jgi:HD-like signal output (HDOD) protein